jgi:urease accessory protein
MPPPAQTRHQRVDGEAAVTLSLRSGRSRLDGLAQRGAAKAMLPRVHGGWPEVVFLNTAGGLTGGDRLRYRLELGAGARAVATTQTAERAYASAGGTASVEVALQAGAGARLHWVPQETILFDRAALHRRTEVALAGTAEALVAEVLVLGRAAMGESLRAVQLTDHRRILRDGRPLVVEPLRLDDATLAGGAAGLNGARALATLVLAAPGAEDALTAARAACAGAGADVTAGASAWDGRCIVRAMARDAAPLRRLVARLIETLGQQGLPRVWQM